MRLLRDTRIGIKVALAPAFTILCLLIVAGLGLLGNASATRTLGSVSKVSMPALTLAVDLERKAAAIHSNVNQSLVWEGAGAQAASIAALDKRIAASMDELGALLSAQAGNAAWSAGDQAILKQLAEAFAKFKKAEADTLDMKATGLAAAAGFITRAEASYAELTRLIDQLVKRQMDSVQGDVVRAEAFGSTTLMATVASLLVAVVLAAVATLWCARLIARPLTRTVSVLNAVASGDFTQRIDGESRDEVGQASDAINRAVDAMRTALREVHVAANEAATASEQVSTASTQMASAAQEQAASLEETAASLEEITGTVKQNADNARQASQLAVGSRDVAVTGGEVVNAAVKAMEEINRSSRKIADIITTIDEIAFQTNLLALNAAVEAARAGEQGRGFAVVAAEVRNLAQRAAVAAKEIKGLIQDSVTKVQAGSELVTKSGATLSEIVASVKRVTDIIAEIAAASSEQTTGIEQVNRAVAQMDQAVQSNAARTEELTSTAQALATQAAQMQELVSRFKVGDEPARPPADSRPVPLSSLSVPDAPPAPSRRRTDKLRATDQPFEAATVTSHGHTNGHANGHTNGHANGHAKSSPEPDGFEEF
jgi:methyl-accepting chemotaxis protein